MGRQLIPRIISRDCAIIWKNHLTEASIVFVRRRLAERSYSGRGSRPSMRPGYEQTAARCGRDARRPREERRWAIQRSERGYAPQRSKQ